MEEPPSNQYPSLYGTLMCGADTWTSALGKERRVFSFNSRLRSQYVYHRTNYYRTKWTNYPSLDLLIVKDEHMGKMHDHWMEDWAKPSRAKHLLVFHGMEALLLYGGKGFKS